MLPLGHLIQPKAEAEVAFILKRDLKGPGVTATDVITATDYVSPCFEIVDSRITDWKIKIQDTIADNASCGVYLIGKARKKLSELDLNLAGMVLERNGELIDTSAGAAVQGGAGQCGRMACQYAGGAGDFAAGRRGYSVGVAIGTVSGGCGRSAEMHGGRAGVV